MQIRTSFILIKVSCLEFDVLPCNFLWAASNLILFPKWWVQDDMINDAAQYFARYIHDTWYRHLMMQEQRISSPTNIVLVCLDVLSHADQLNAVPPECFSHSQLNIGAFRYLYQRKTKFATSHLEQESLLFCRGGDLNMLYRT